MRQAVNQAERGAIALLAAIVLMVVGGFLALIVNVGHKMTNKAQLQAAFDAAALAGAMTLNGTAANLPLAKSDARTYGTSHFMDKIGIQIANANDVRIGYWNKNNLTFYPDFTTAQLNDGTLVTLNETAAVLKYYNAVKVRGGADGLSGHNALQPVYFSAFLGNSTYGVSAGAVAVGGGPCNDSCPLPLIATACSLLDAGGNVNCGGTFSVTMAPSPTNNGAWSLFDTSNPNTPSIRNQFTAANTSTCTGGGSATAFAPAVRIANGNQIHAVADTITPLICVPGNCRAFTVGVIDDVCNAALVGDHVVKAFVRMEIMGVTDTGSDKHIDLRIRCGDVSNGTTGCVSYGFSARPRLVQ